MVVLGLLLPLSSGQFEGLGRYCSVLFPLSDLLGSLKGETRHLGLMTGFVLFYTLGLVLFGNVHPLFCMLLRDVAPARRRIAAPDREERLSGRNLAISAGLCCGTM